MPSSYLTRVIWRNRWQWLFDVAFWFCVCGMAFVAGWAIVKFADRWSL